MSVQEKISDYMRERDFVSFAELERNIAGFKGEGLYSAADSSTGETYSTVVLWPGVSDEAHAALQSLLKDGRIFLHPAEPFIYLVDGAVPKMPVAKKLKNYKKLHWLPVTLCKFPPEGRPQ